MIVVTHEDIMKLNIQPLQCLEWAKEMIAQKDRALLKPKISMKFGENGFYNTMPAMLPCEDVVGVKVVSRYAQRTPSLDSQLLLYNLETGRLDALMDANFITTMRTGAVAAFSIQTLATTDFSEIGMIGLGNTARATFQILMAIYPKRKFRVKLKKYKNQHEDFINTFYTTGSNIEFVLCDTYDEVVLGSDVVISSVTFSGEIFCADECYKEGCLVVPIHTRGFQNCDLFFDKIFADDKGHVQNFQYFTQFRDFAELSDVILGRHRGRVDDKERILIYNIGIAIHDVYFAKKIFEMLSVNCDFPEVTLNHLEEKFWVK